jgi:hypothetical protein
VGSAVGTCGPCPPPDAGSSSSGMSSSGASSSGGTTGDGGVCSSYGQGCTSSADCCNGVPCTGNTCHYPIQ